MAKTSPHEQILHTFIDIQKQQQRPMGLHEYIPLIAEKFPVEAAKDEFKQNCRTYCHELLKKDIFVEAPRKITGPGFKKIVLYGLPENVPGGIRYEDKKNAEIQARLVKIAALFASSTRTATERHIYFQKLKNTEGEELTSDQLKLTFEFFKKVNLETIDRLKKDFLLVLRDFTRDVEEDNDLIENEPPKDTPA